MTVLNVLIDRGPADVWDVLADGSALDQPEAPSLPSDIVPEGT
jgi:hypothetical protein